jgi:hypothetical protein
LYDQHRHTNVSKLGGDVPLAEIGIEPSPVPAEEGAVDVGMPARKPRAQVSRLVGLARLRDGGNADVLCEEMRRDQNKPAEAMILVRAGIDCPDRGAVAVAEQQPALKSDRIEQ